MNSQGLVIHPDGLQLLEQFLQQPAHAVVLAGAAGSGKTLIAQRLAEALLGDADLAAQHNAYYRVVAPVKNTITIEQVRDLTHFFRLQVPGHAAVKRVAVIQDADAMGTEAQNALLKLLEEPPEGSVLLLTSSHLPGLLPTIRSRVQAITLPHPAAQSLEEHFVAQGHNLAVVKKASARHGSNIAALARALQEGGAPDAALELVKQALSGTSYDRLLLVDSLAKQKEQAGAFVATLAAVAMASLESAANRGVDSLKRWQNVLHAAHTADAALRRSGNAKLVLTELMLSL